MTHTRTRTCGWGGEREGGRWGRGKEGGWGEEKEGGLAKSLRCAVFLYEN